MAFTSAEANTPSTLHIPNSEELGHVQVFLYNLHQVFFLLKQEEHRNIETAAMVFWLLRKISLLKKEAKAIACSFNTGGDISHPWRAFCTEMDSLLEVAHPTEGEYNFQLTLWLESHWAPFQRQLEERITAYYDGCYSLGHLYACEGVVSEFLGGYAGNFLNFVLTIRRQDIPLCLEHWEASIAASPNGEAAMLRAAAVIWWLMDDDMAFLAAPATGC